jgi:hypothetical protein
MVAHAYLAHRFSSRRAAWSLASIVGRTVEFRGHELTLSARLTLEFASARSPPLMLLCQRAPERRI